jgi:hypothetical protein
MKDYLLNGTTTRIVAGNPKRIRNILAYCSAEWYTVSDRMIFLGKEVK